MPPARCDLKLDSSPRINVIAILLFSAVFLPGLYLAISWKSPSCGVGSLLLGLLLGRAPQISNQWERAIVLRLGKFRSRKGPGLFWIVPFIDTIAAWIDQRTITTKLRRRTDAHCRHRPGER